MHSCHLAHFVCFLLCAAVPSLRAGTGKDIYYPMFLLFVIFFFIGFSVGHLNGHFWNSPSKGVVGVLANSTNSTNSTDSTDSTM